MAQSVWWQGNVLYRKRSVSKHSVRKRSVGSPTIGNWIERISITRDNTFSDSFYIMPVFQNLIFLGSQEIKILQI